MKLPDTIIQWLRHHALGVIDSRPPNIVIGDIGPGGEGNPYMERWHDIKRNAFMNVYIHNFLRSDNAVLHDHPAAGVSIILWGSYTEVSFIPGKPRDGRWFTRTQYMEGDVIFRRANTPHRIELASEPPNPPVVTMWITGPKLREWGFWCPKGWRNWKEFGAYETAGRQGCGED